MKKIISNENGKVVYRKTTFLSDKIEYCASPDSLSLKVKKQLNARVCGRRCDRFCFRECANFE